MSDSITWRQFCRIGIDQPVPHPTTLMKLTTRCGSAAVDGLNEALLAKAVEAKVLRTTKIRVDTTVVPANVAYPTDSGLLAKAVNRIAATGRRIQAAGGAVRTKLRDRSRAAGRRAHDLNAKLRTRNAAAKDEALAVVRRKNARARRSRRDRRGRGRTAAGQRETSHPDSAAEGRRARKAEGRKDPAAGRRRGRLVRAVNDLTDLLDATRRIAAQTAFLRNHQAVRDTAELLASNPYPMSPEAYERQADAYRQFDALDRLGAITAPTLVVVGEQDLLTPPWIARGCRRDPGRTVRGHPRRRVLARGADRAPRRLQPARVGLPFPMTRHQPHVLIEPAAAVGRGAGCSISIAWG